jgi:two-component system, chemotaxis family, sensor kinase CheA
VFVADGKQPIVVVGDEHRSMGLLVDAIVDIVEAVVEIEVGSPCAGVLGSALINGRATEIVDMTHFLPLAFDDWLGSYGRRTGRPPRHILLIDDAPFCRDMLAPVLRSAGYAVTPVGSARAGLAHLQEGGAVDCVITNLELPDMDGFALVAALRQNPNTADLPVIGLAPSVSAALVERGRQAGLRDYVAKFDRQGLIAALKSRLDDMDHAA